MLFSKEVINVLKSQGKRVDYLEQQYLDDYYKRNPGNEVDIFVEGDYSTENIVKLSEIEVLQMQFFGRTITESEISELALVKPNVVKFYRINAANI